MGSNNLLTESEFILKLFALQKKVKDFKDWSVNIRVVLPSGENLFLAKGHWSTYHLLTQDQETSSGTTIKNQDSVYYYRTLEELSEMLDFIIGNPDIYNKGRSSDVLDNCKIKTYNEELY